MLIYNWNGTEYISKNYNMISSNNDCSLFHIYDFTNKPITKEPMTVMISNANWEMKRDEA